jgi:hypothetical protein
MTTPRAEPAALRSGDVDERRFDEIFDLEKIVGHGFAGS